MPRFSLLSTLAGAAVAALAACVPPQPATTPAGAAPRPRISPPASVTHPPPRYVAGHFTYQVESRGIVTSPQDTAEHPDTVATQSTVTYDSRWQGGQLLIAGAVQYRIVEPQGLARRASTVAKPGSPPPASTAAGASTSATPAAAASDSASAPLEREHFEIRVDTATGAFGTPGDSAAVPACVSSAVVEQDEVLAADRPRSLAPGAQWTDTVTKFSCLAGIPVSTRTIRTFDVAHAPAPDPITGAPCIVVNYASDITIDGEARRHADLLTIHATGRETTDQYYDRTTGVLLSAHTTVIAYDLDAAVNGRAQPHWHQTAEWRARKD